MNLTPELAGTLAATAGRLHRTKSELVRELIPWIDKLSRDFVERHPDYPAIGILPALAAEYDARRVAMAERWTELTKELDQYQAARAAEGKPVFYRTDRIAIMFAHECYKRGKTAAAVLDDLASAKAAAAAKHRVDVDELIEREIGREEEMPSNEPEERDPTPFVLGETHREISPWARVAILAAVFVAVVVGLILVMRGF